MTACSNDKIETMTQVFLGIAGFVLMLGVLILIHELGHFLAAKLFGVRVETFSIGFVGAIFHFRWGETEYRLGWLPLGGYVRMLGDADDTVRDPDLQKRAFSHKPLWQRAIIVLAGPFANLVVLPGLVFGGMFLAQKQELSSMIGTVLAERPAAKAGLQPGDRILAVNGQPVRYFRQLRQLIETSPGQSVTLQITRDSRTLTLRVTPESYTQKDLLGTDKQRGIIGITVGFRTSEIGISDHSSPAYRAGLRTFDRIVAINDVPTKRWDQIENYRKQYPRGPYRYTFRRQLQTHNDVVQWQGYAKPQTVTVSPVVTVDSKTKQVISYDGVSSSEGFVTNIFRGTPFANTPIRVGDKLISIENRPIRTASDLTTLPRKQNQIYRVVYLHQGQTKQTQFTLKPTVWVDPFKQRHPRLILGVVVSTPYASGEMIDIDQRWKYALQRAWEETWLFTGLIIRSIGKLFTREIPADSIGGPIMIFQVAQEAVKSGWDVFLQQLVLISINLGLINLLPIPVLDGGHLTFFLIEGITRRPVPPQAKYWALMIGFALLLFLMLFALRNDLQRLFSP